MRLDITKKQIFAWSIRREEALNNTKKINSFNFLNDSLEFSDSVSLNNLGPVRPASLPIKASTLSPRLGFSYVYTSEFLAKALNAVYRSLALSLLPKDSVSGSPNIESSRYYLTAIVFVSWLIKVIHKERDTKLIFHNFKLPSNHADLYAPLHGFYCGDFALLGLNFSIDSELNCHPNKVTHKTNTTQSSLTIFYSFHSNRLGLNTVMLSNDSIDSCFICHPNYTWSSKLVARIAEINMLTELVHVLINSKTILSPYNTDASNHSNSVTQVPSILEIFDSVCTELDLYKVESADESRQDTEDYIDTVDGEHVVINQSEQECYLFERLKAVEEKFLLAMQVYEKAIIARL